MNGSRLANAIAPATGPGELPAAAHGLASCPRCRVNVFTAHLRAVPGAGGVVTWDGTEADWRGLLRALGGWSRGLAPGEELVLVYAVGRGEGHRCAVRLDYRQPGEVDR